MANPSLSEAAASCKAPKKLTCLCSPTNHPGSFRCSRHRTPRARSLPLSSSSMRASLPQAAAPDLTGVKSGWGSKTTTSKGPPVLRTHLQRLLASPPPSSGGRCREFNPHLSRLGRLAVNA